MLAYVICVVYHYFFYFRTLQWYQSLDLCPNMGSQQEHGRFDYECIVMGEARFKPMAKGKSNMEKLRG